MITGGSSGVKDGGADFVCVLMVPVSISRHSLRQERNMAQGIRHTRSIYAAEALVRAMFKDANLSGATA